MNILRPHVLKTETKERLIAKAGLEANVELFIAHPKKEAKHYLAFGSK